MGPFVSYMIQSALVMTMLYLAYKWLMASTTFHSLNRAALLGIYIMSWILPALLPIMAHSNFSGPSTAVTLDVLPAAVVVNSPSEPSFDWWRLALGVYLFGVAATACYSLLGAVRVCRIISSGIHTRKQGYIKVVSASAPGPFSWGRYIVLRPVDCDAYEDMVVVHEAAHLRRWHWLDLLLAQITAVLQWFSPAAWLMMRELKTVHEFQADREAGAGAPADYQIMLLKKTVGSSFPTFADSLNHSQIKLRITMMMNKRTSPSRKAAALALPVVAALSAMTLTIPAVADVASAIGKATLADTEFSNSKINESFETLQMPATAAPSPLRTVDGDVDEATVVEEAVAVENAVAEDQASQDSEKKKPSPVIFIDGKESRGDLSAVDPKDIVAIDVVKNDPAYPQGKIMVTTVKASDGAKRPAQAAEELAEYKGGFKALASFLAANIKYPAEAAKAGIEGRVIISFTINTDGTLSDLKVMKGVNEELDHEAERVVKLTSGQWIPATTDGHPVATRFTLPVQFKATESE